MRIQAKVIPGAKKERIISSESGLKVYLTVPALEGRANEKLIEVLARHYAVKKRSVSIIRGQKQRNKLIQIDDA